MTSTLARLLTGRRLHAALLAAAMLYGILLGWAQLTAPAADPHHLVPGSGPGSVVVALDVSTPEAAQPTEPTASSGNVLAAGTAAPTEEAGTQVWAADEIRKRVDPTDKDPVKHYLPAIRWQMTGLEYGNDGNFGGNIVGIFAALSTFFFLIAGVVWWCVLWLVNAALSLDMVHAAAGKINTIAEQIHSSLEVAGVAALVFLGLVFAAWKALRTSSGARIIPMLVAVLVPVAVLQITMSSTTQFNKQGNPTYNTDGLYGLTPAGLAERGTQAVRKYVDPLVFSIGGASVNPKFSNVAPCDYYSARLYAEYNNRTKNAYGFTPTAMVMLSRMWEEVHFTQLTKVQYGDVKEGWRAICHQAEAQADISASTQAAIASAKGAPDGGYKKISLKPDSRSPFYQFEVGEKSWSAFADISHHRQKNSASRMLWIACNYDDVESSRKRTEAREKWSNQVDHLDELCADWMKAGTKLVEKNWFQYENEHKVRDEFKNSRQGQIYVTYVGYPGHGVGSSLMTGLISILTALAYGVALIIPAVGASVASAAAAIFLAILPVTLLLLAVPSTDRSGNSSGLRKIGNKLLRSTGTFLLTEAIFVVLLVLFIQLIAIFNAVLGVG